MKEASLAEGKKLMQKRVMYFILFFVILATSINCLNHQRKQYIFDIYMFFYILNKLSSMLIIITADLHMQFRHIYDRIVKLIIFNLVTIFLIHRLQLLLKR